LCLYIAIDVTSKNICMACINGIQLKKHTLQINQMNKFQKNYWKLKFAILIPLLRLTIFVIIIIIVNNKTICYYCYYDKKLWISIEYHQKMALFVASMVTFFVIVSYYITNLILYIKICCELVVSFYVKSCIGKID
jgi:hypothetical protein